ncbi:MAG TPA: Wzz/FepE/Etk N-terminal domain-containing protein [Puia sp.]|jgi:succinoglycan biosynthesis transport protein ExoP|nr:Wzz/FepE/Etk N-terminal domain-containing protein [Puia sp.]
MDLAYLFRVLLKRKWIIIGSSVLAAIIAYFLTRHEPKTYLSSTRVSTGFAVPDEIRVGENNYNPYDADVKFNNAINTWNSPAVVSLLSYELILHDLTSQDPFRPLSAQDRQSPAYRSIDLSEAVRVFTEKLRTMTVLTSYKDDERKLLEFLNLYGYSYKYLIQNITITQVQHTDYIEVDGKTENPELSAFMVNHLFDQFIRYYRNIRSTESQESIDTLQSIMEKKRQVWDDKKKLLEGSGIIDASLENSGRMDQITQYTRSLSDEESKQTDYYYELRRVNQKLQSLGDPKTPGTPSNLSNNANTELIAARNAMNDAYNTYLKTNSPADLQRYNQLKTEYYSKFPNSKPSTSEKNDMPDNKADLMDKKGDIEANIQASNDKIKDLESKITGLRNNVSSASSKNAASESLQTEAKQAEKDYFDAKQRYTTALDLGSSSVNNFRQLQLAQPAIEPEPSKRALIVVLSGAVTFMSVVLLIMMLTFLDSTTRTPTLFSKLIPLKLLSIVNFVNLRGRPVGEIVTASQSEKDRMEQRRSNLFRESIRKVRYEIEMTGKQIFLFTSTKKGEGKTLLVQAISHSLSMSKKRVLVIDTNFSNNDLTVQMHGEPVLEEIHENGVQETVLGRVKSLSKEVGVGTDHVYIIGSRGGDYTPTEVLPRENILTQLHVLVNEFDYIFLEGPPLNDFSDSRELARYVDGVIAVFSAVRTIKQIDRESINFFKELDGKFCGSVLNKVDLENLNAL